MVSGSLADLQSVLDVFLTALWSLQETGHLQQASGVTGFIPILKELIQPMVKLLKLNISYYALSRAELTGELV